MINLIKNELSKIFHKKAIYIIFLIMIVIIILDAYFTYKYNQEDNNHYNSGSNYIEYYDEYLKSLDPTNANQINEYIEVKTEIDLYNLQQEYETSSWQYNIIYEEMYGYVYNINTYKYGPEKGEQKLKEAEEEYNKVLQRLNNDDWKYFANEKLTIAKEELKELEEQKKNTQDTSMLKEIDAQIEKANLNIDIINLRLNNDISYARSYKNTAVNSYEEAKIYLIDYDNQKEHTYEEEKEYNQMIEQEATSKYIIETGKDINADNTLSYNIRGAFDETSGLTVFIALVGIVIGGTIVSEEFNKGTIKMLLVRPYSRTKILIAKYITSIIMVIITMLALFASRFIICGIAFGFDTINIPQVMYNFNTGSLQEIGAFTYALIRAGTILPSLILITTLAFAVSTITTSSPLAIGLPLIGYMYADLVNELISLAVESHKFEFVKYFVTEHWNLSNYLYGGLPDIQGFTPTISLIICAVYLVIMIIPTFVFFKKRNIKNV